MIIELDNINVRFGTQKILDSVNVRFSGGSAGLLGPNGAGKTTLLNTLLGFIEPESGTGRVLGCDIRKEQLGIRQKIGYMPENDCHIPGMNAVSYVAYAGQLSGMKPKDALRRAHETLFYVGLGEARYRNVETYSAGMKQRIKLAQALVHDPELVFLDEPTNGLDPKGRMEMLELIRDISSTKGIHVVLSSHLLPDVEWVCREAMVIHKGRMLASGNIEDLKRGSGAVYEVRLKGDGSGFADKLEALGCRCTRNEDGVLRIRMAGGLDSRTLLEAARDGRVQIRHLVPLRQSLEDVFLQVIGESHADS
ncbi:MAG: ABC transporter ATP-binding protein [Acidobacteria bacterium]|nr:ABC transporter ATP-binding protein [Acidobacteriota bacterium]